MRAKQESSSLNFHSLELNEIFNLVASSKNGLSKIEAEIRLKTLGLNKLPEAKPISRLKIFLSQFQNPLSYIILTAVAISIFLGNLVDTLFIIFVGLINALVSFFEEIKAEQTFEELRSYIRFSSKILRDGKETIVDSEEVVPGDILILSIGDKIPADARIIEAKNLTVDESTLTGETFPVQKKAEVVAKEAVLADRDNMVFAGTIIAEGSGKAIIVATGIETELGKIARLIKETKSEETPLQRKLRSLSGMLGIMIMGFVFLIVIIGFIRGMPPAEILLASLALAVSAIPEGLLPAITIVLVLAMRQILKRKALVKKLMATETLGSITTICTDKTGTLTEGKMQVDHILTGTHELLHKDHRKNYDLNGTEGHILALKIVTLANDAIILNPEDKLSNWVIHGRPTDRALLIAGMESGLSKLELEKEYPKIDTLSFESGRQYAASLHKKSEFFNTLFLVGASETIFDQCKSIYMSGKDIPLTPHKIEELKAKYESYAKKGLRVIACAYRDIKKDRKYEKLDDLVNDLVLVGFITLKDPLRPESKEAIQIAREAGIRPIIITGDHRLTAAAIGDELGFEIKDHKILEGGDLDQISDEELQKLAKEVNIYARISPYQKLRIVSALQANGEIVAMTGDGVNDAPALKKANIGLALGSGSEAAKEAADIILIENNFKTITDAIEEGRAILNKIRKLFVYLVADDFSELILFAGALAFAMPIPLMPTQILWINLIEDAFPSMAFTVEEKDKGLMKEPPRRPDEPILHKPLRNWMIAIALITGCAAIFTYLFLLKFIPDIEKARTILFALMSVDSLIFAFAVRAFKKPMFSRDILANQYLNGAAIFGLAFMFAAIYFPPFEMIAKTIPMELNDWTIVVLVSTIEIILIELAKWKLFSNK